MMTNMEKLEEAIDCAIRFIERAEELRAQVQGDHQGYGYSFPKESGAVRRSSMELTRSLARLRSPG